MSREVLRVLQDQVADKLTIKSCEYPKYSQKCGHEMVWSGRYGSLWCMVLGSATAAVHSCESLRSGIRVRCTAERSQQDNRSKAKAMAVGGATGSRKLLNATDISIISDAATF